ncbi:MAG: YdcF family protein [Nitrospirae bacterium]|nr:YdcF family protein [Nitrospirota bacterium]
MVCPTARLDEGGTRPRVLFFQAVKMIRLLKLFFLIAFVAGIIFLTHGFVFTKAAEMLIRKDEMKPADVIVVLAGEQEERVLYGIKLFKDEWARKDRIIMAGGPLVWKYTWASLMKEQAESLGIPGKKILLEDKSRSTEEDALYTKEILKKNGFKSIILVTSPYHSRRAALIFNNVLGSEFKIISAPADESWFNVNDWWKRRRDRAAVLNEFSKYVWLWLFGLQEKA